MATYKNVTELNKSVFEVLNAILMEKQMILVDEVVYEEDTNIYSVSFRTPGRAIEKAKISGEHINTLINRAVADPLADEVITLFYPAYSTAGTFGK